MTERGPVVITGASGRIGRVVAAGLAAQGVDLRLADKTPPPESLAHLDFFAADICDGVAMTAVMADASAVVHLAALPNSRDWTALEHINFRGTRTVFNAAVAAGVSRIVYASSVHVCGFAPNDALLQPSMPYRPDSPYGVSKVFGETLLQQLCDQYSITGVALRICSFLPAPTQARHLRTFLSHPDSVRLVLASLGGPAKGFSAVWGTSDNRRAGVDRDHWQAIGYAPQDDAEQYVDALRSVGVDTALVSEWPFLGGSFAVKGVSD